MRYTSPGYRSAYGSRRMKTCVRVVYPYDGQNSQLRVRHKKGPFLLFVGGKKFYYDAHTATHTTTRYNTLQHTLQHTACRRSLLSYVNLPKNQFKNGMFCVRVCGVSECECVGVRACMRVCVCVHRSRMLWMRVRMDACMRL